MRAAPGRAHSWPSGLLRTVRPYSQNRFVTPWHRADWWSQPKHAKQTASGLFWPCGRDRNAQIWVGGFTFPCPVLNEKSRSSLVQPKRFSIVWFGRHVGLNLFPCAMVHSLFSLSVGASVYMRVSIAAFRPKKSARRLFCMFRLAELSLRDAVG